MYCEIKYIFFILCKGNPFFINIILMSYYTYGVTQYLFSEFWFLLRTECYYHYDKDDFLPLANRNRQITHILKHFHY